MQSESPRRGRGRPRKIQTTTPPEISLEDRFPIPGGLYRERDFLGPGRIPISHSSLWNGVKSGIYPAPRRIGPNAVAWLGADLQKIIDGLKPIEPGQRGGGSKK